MKKQLILYITLISIGVFSCRDISLEPKGILDESELFSNEFGAKKYFAAIYNSLPIEDFIYYGANSNTAYRPDNYWEQGKFSQGNMSGEFFNTWAEVDNDGFAYWPYDRIRDVNTFLKNFPKYKEEFNDDVYNSLLGEAHFLRAFYYFGLAKRYGGVPLVKEPQDPLAAAETLEVTRNKEYETWKFIYEDLTFAIANMGTTSETGRANKYVAAALLSRAMLYAGSIAKYNQYLGFQGEAATRDGLAGMDPSQADEFFQYCVDAGKVVEQGPYSLYTRGYPNKAENFANLFLDATSSENIFIKDYDMTVPGNTRLRHSYDALMSPQPDMSSFVGAESYPPLDFMELYEMPAIVDPNDGTPVRFDNRGDIRNEMEPRALGTMYFDSDVLRGKKFDIQRGIYKTFDGPASAADHGSSAAPINNGDNRILGGRGWTTNINGVTYTIAGAHGNFEDQGGENNCWGSAFIRKYVNSAMPTSDVREYRSGQPWIVFRLGEIYLNTAEALYELKSRDEAFNYVEQIRVRAGAKTTRPAIETTTSNIGTINKANYPYQIEKSLQYIRDERARELYGENHWWWDLRRWRTADQVLNQFRPRVLSCYFVADEGKYIYLDENNRQNRGWTASRACYYEPIPWGEIGKNKKLLPQNPLY